MSRLKTRSLRLAVLVAISFFFILLATSPRSPYDNKEENDDQNTLFADLAQLWQQPQRNFIGDDYSSIQFNNSSFNEKTGNVGEPIIAVRERYKHSFRLGGAMFDQHGNYARLEHDVVSCLAHSFSPLVEREAARRFLDPARDNIYFANSPAIEWWRGELVLVSRIWLDRERYEAKRNWPANDFADNWLFTQRFDRRLRPTAHGSIIGLPSPKQWWVGDGPIEPRLFVVANRLFISFNAAMAVARGNHQDLTVLWDYERNEPIIPQIRGGSPMIAAAEKGDMPRDKHWSATIINDQLYFVHNLDPLRVLHCSLDGDCEFVHEEKLGDGPAFSDTFSHLRGGTPFKPYKMPYYIGVAHCTMYKETAGWHRYYTTHIVLLRVEPTFRIVYVSDDISIHPAIYKLAPMVRTKYIDDGFIFPVSILLPTDDIIDIGVHVNDYSSVIIRVKGMKSVMLDIIKQDMSRQVTLGVMHGPPPGSIQRYMHDNLEKKVNMKFVHQTPI